MSASLPRLRVGPQATSIALVENLTGGTPRHATSVEVTRVDGLLTFEFRCRGLRPWSALTERDAPLWNEEVVEIFVDPIGDGLGYFEIEVNPCGAICDLVLRRIASGWRRDFAWNCEGLAVRTEVREDGWNAWVELPVLSLVNESPAAGAGWRVNFYRIDRPGGPESTRELSAWSPTFGPTFHDPRRFGWLEF